MPIKLLFIETKICPLRAKSERFSFSSHNSHPRIGILDCCFLDIRDGFLLMGSKSERGKLERNAEVMHIAGA